MSAGSDPDVPDSFRTGRLDAARAAAELEMVRSEKRALMERLRDVEAQLMDLPAAGGGGERPRARSGRPNED